MLLTTRWSGAVVGLGLALLAGEARADAPATAPAADPSPVTPAPLAPATPPAPSTALAPVMSPAATASAAAPGPLAPGRRALSAGAALVPGVLVHGSGQFAAGRPGTGWKLLAVEGVGVGMAVGGVVGLAVTGASRRLVGPLAYVTIGGVALFTTSLLADLYGVLAPPGGTGSPRVIQPWVETEVGLRYVYDPVFAYRALAVQGIDARLGAWRLSPSVWTALDERNARWRLEGAYRLAGPRPRGGEPARDGSYLEVEGALTHHDYGREGFAMTSGELSLRGRLDLRRLSADLTGSFVEASAGHALESYHYDSIATEANEALLARFGYGIYLGRPGGVHGEAMLVYDHRRDGYVGGMRVPGIGAGYLGSAGVRSRLYLTRHWGLLAEAQVGSALVAGLSLLFRHGDTP